MKLSPSSPVFWGIIATFVLVLTGVVLAFGETCGTSGDCVPRWSQFANAPFNEVGDTLAGFAGAMAFVWIIVTVLLQSRELGAQREELRLTRKEFSEQRKATQDMARSMAAQAKIFELEQLQKSQSLAASQFEELAQFFKEEIANSSPFWQLKLSKDGRLMNIDLVQGRLEGAKSKSPNDIISFFRGLTKNVSDISQYAETARLKGDLVNAPSKDTLQSSLAILLELYSQIDELGPAGKARSERMQIVRLRKNLDILLQQDIWS